MSGPNKAQIWAKTAENGKYEMWFEDKETHDSMVYGMDYTLRDISNIDLVTCSFYDGLLNRQILSYKKS